VDSEADERSGLNLVEVMCALLISGILSFRLISLPLLAAAIIVARCAGRRSPWVVALRCAFAVSLLSPVDLPLLGMYRNGGAHRSGPRLVRCVVGMPAHTALITRYGEYYSLGCSGYTLNSPRWMLVLF
jgi:prepilin-type N-terminal cleavage/methylation domain-containing protein